MRKEKEFEGICKKAKKVKFSRPPAGRTPVMYFFKETVKIMSTGNADVK